MNYKLNQPKSLSRNATNPIDETNNTQMQDIFTDDSIQIQQSMTNKHFYCKTKPKTLHNNIFHSTVKHNVPTEQAYTTHNQTKYHQFYRMHHKFKKPYGDFTQYIDTLRKNSTLLRRAQFDTPSIITIEPRVNYNNQSKQTQSCIARKSNTTSNITKRSYLSYRNRNDCFQKTLRTQATRFNNFLEEGCKDKKQNVLLYNSLNRLLAAEMINVQLDNILLKRNNVAKKQR